MNKAKLVIAVCVALLVAFLGGWAWSAFGNRELNRAFQASQLRSDLLEAYSSVLDARLEIYSVNFGQASQHLEDARAQLHRADERLKVLDRQADAASLETAFTKIDEAQRLSGQLDQTANARSAEAATIIKDVMGRDR